MSQGERAGGREGGRAGGREGGQEGGREGGRENVGKMDPTRASARCSIVIMTNVIITISITCVIVSAILVIDVTSAIVFTTMMITITTIAVVNMLFAPTVIITSATIATQAESAPHRHRHRHRHTRLHARTFTPEIRYVCITPLEYNKHTVPTGRRQHMAAYAPCKRAPPCASVGNSIPYTVCLVLSQYDKRASERAETLRRPSEKALVCASESRRSVQSRWIPGEGHSGVAFERIKCTAAGREETVEQNREQE